MPDSDPSMYCRTCRHALNTRRAGGGLEYLHAVEARGGRSDHRPDPVPLAELPDAIQVCDFCDQKDVANRYRCADRVTDSKRITKAYMRRSDYVERHRAARVIRTDTELAQTNSWGQWWTACAPCAVLIEQRALDQLITRVTEHMPAKFLRGNRLARIRGYLRDDYSHFFATLLPGRDRITPGHLPATADPDEGADPGRQTDPNTTGS